MLGCICGGIVELALIGTALMSAASALGLTNLYNRWRRRKCECRCCPHNREN